MDNLSAHKTRGVQSLMQELKIEWIYNVPYSPSFQPIETVFSQVKRAFKLDKLRALLTAKTFDQRAAVRRSFASIDSEFVDKCILHCLARIHNHPPTLSCSF